MLRGIFVPEEESRINVEKKERKERKRKEKKGRCIYVEEKRGGNFEREEKSGINGKALFLPGCRRNEEGYNIIS